jgi:endonuclease/exonuclease/phosphatase family metal-dependent hydrolase
MKRSFPLILAFGLLFLFIVQLAGMLVESIYLLDLMNLRLDIRVLGLLFFFTPILLLPFRRKLPGWTVWMVFAFLFVARGLTPYLDTFGRMMASGIGIGAALLFFSFLASARARAESTQALGISAAVGLALAVALSVLLRTLNFSLDYSLTVTGGWVGWGLGLLLGWALTQLDWDFSVRPQPEGHGVTVPILGIFLVIILIYFSFSAPAVIARWTEGNYPLIVGAVSLFSAGWAILAVARPRTFGLLSRGGLLLWNALFTLSLTGTILAHRVSFPPAPNSPSVVVGAPGWIQQVPLVLMLLLFPVLFLDLQFFFTQLRQAEPAPWTLIPGVLLGALALVVLVFMGIFTNVWGYIAPVSTPFRNLFWLPYLLAAGVLSLLVWVRQPAESSPVPGMGGSMLLGWVVLMGIIFLATGAYALRTDQPHPGDPNKTSLLVMTYNLQAGNDASGQRSYDRQLAVMRRVSPDLIALQESDTARLSLDNDDLVRYFAGNLGYYSYYGPATVTGTFGTAILSRYPLENTRSVFSFSDQDEIGTSEAEIVVDGQRFSIHDVHPDGSDTAKMALARSLLDRSQSQANVIALGDFNLTETAAAYQLVAGRYTEAWASVYPSGIGPEGMDMSGRIDHIFVSTGLGVRDPVYLQPPASASDHPVHWAVIFWKK